MSAVTVVGVDTYLLNQSIMAHQTASAAAFKSKMASRMTARTLVRTALQRAGKPLTLHQLYECVSSNSDIIPSKTFFRNDVLSPLKANAQVRSAELDTVMLANIESPTG